SLRPPGRRPIRQGPKTDRRQAALSSREPAPCVEVRAGHVVAPSDDLARTLFSIEPREPVVEPNPIGDLLPPGWPSIHSIAPLGDQTSRSNSLEAAGLKCRRATSQHPNASASSWTAIVSPTF